MNKKVDSSRVSVPNISLAILSGNQLILSEKNTIPKVLMIFPITPQIFPFHYGNAIRNKRWKKKLVKNRFFFLPLCLPSISCFAKWRRNAAPSPPLTHLFENVAPGWWAKVNILAHGNKGLINDHMRGTQQGGWPLPKALSKRFHCASYDYLFQELSNVEKFLTLTLLKLHCMAGFIHHFGGYDIFVSSDKCELFVGFSNSCLHFDG